MCMTDPISDMFTRIRNACMIKRESVDVPASKIKLAILNILKEDGFIKEFKEMTGDSDRRLIRVYLKYGPLKQQLINKIERVSKSSRRIYKKVEGMEKVCNGVGTAIYSTSKGVISDRGCRKMRVGGELLCIVL